MGEGLMHGSLNLDLVFVGFEQKLRKNRDSIFLGGAKNDRNISADFGRTHIFAPN